MASEMTKDVSVARVLEKVAVLLEKTRDALIRDLQQEFVGVRRAIDAFEKDQSVKNFVPIIDAVFAKVGYDISHYEELSEVRDVVGKLLDVTDQIAKVVEEGSRISADGEVEVGEIAALAQDIVPLIQELVSLVRMVSDIEWRAVAADLRASGKAVGATIQEELFNQDFARKVLDHILMTLLRNARNVFADEIEFVRFTINSGINQLVADANALRETIKKNISEVVDDLDRQADLVQNALQETLIDAQDLYTRMGQQMESQLKGDLQTLAREYKDTYVRIANGLSITYSILEFLGIMEEKEITLQLPDGLKDAVSRVQKAADEVSGKIGAAVTTASALVADSTAKVIDTMDDAMKTTRDVTGIGVAAAGKVDLQLQCINDFMGATTTDLQTGLATIAAAAGGAMSEVSKYTGQAQQAVAAFSDKLEAMKNFRYPMKLNLISWERVGSLFTDPVGHFRSLYPINSMADAEALMTRIMDILHRINPDIPDFSSLKRLLENLLRRLQHHVMKLIAELREKAAKAVGEAKRKLKEMAGKVWEWFQPIVTTVRSVIRMLKDLALALKDKMQDVLDEVKDGVKVITDQLGDTFEEIKRDLGDVAKGIEDGISDVARDVENGVNRIGSEAEKRFKEVASAAENRIREVQQAAESTMHELEKQADAAMKQAEQAATAAYNQMSADARKAYDEAQRAGQQRATEMQRLFEDLKKDMPRMPRMNLPAIVRTTLAEPLTDAVRATVNDVLDIDLTPVFDFGQQRRELVASVTVLRKDYSRLKERKAEAWNVLRTSAGLSESDFTAVVALDFNTAWKDSLALPNIPLIVQQEVVPDLKAWAYGMVTSIQAVTNPNVWKQRLDTVVNQLKAEFQNDLSGITGLISKEGAMRLYNDSEGVKKQLKDEINITDYINILETAVSDVVLPDPEYYYSSFKTCILGIITKLTARILDEVKRVKDAVVGAKDAILALPAQIKTNVETLLGKLQAAYDRLKNGMQGVKDSVVADVKAIIEDLLTALTTIRDIARKVPATVEALVDFFKNKAKSVLDNLASRVEDMLKEIGQRFLDKLEDLAAEMWKRFKNDYLIPFLRYIKNQVILFVKRVLKQKIRQLLDALTDLRADAENEVAKLFREVPFLKAMREAQQTFARELNARLKELAPQNEFIRKNLPNGITDLRQIGPLVRELRDSAPLQKQILQNLVLRIPYQLESLPAASAVESAAGTVRSGLNSAVQSGLSTATGTVQSAVSDLKSQLATIDVPYYYITWIQGIVSSTMDFVQSDMGLKEILALVQSLYQGIPEEVKQQVADVLPSLPRLPKNEFTDLLDDVTCSYDLDNMMANVTLLDLKRKNTSAATDTVQWDASLKLQLFLMVGQYSKDGFVEARKEDEDAASDDAEGEGSAASEATEDAAPQTVPAIFCTLMLGGQVMLTFRLGDNHHITLRGDGQIGTERLTEETRDVAVGFCLSKRDPEKGVCNHFHGFGSTRSLGALLYGEFSRNIDESGHTQPAQILSTQYLDIRIGNYPLVAYVLYNHAYPKADKQSPIDIPALLGIEKADAPVEGFTAGVAAALKDMEFVLKLRQNAFFASLLKDDISAKFDLALAYDYLKGFKMNGGYTFHIDIDTDNRKIGPITLSGLGIEVGSAKDDVGTLKVGLDSTFSLQFGEAVTMTFDKLGTGMSVNVVKRDAHGFKYGDFDFDTDFKFPEGIGVAINCSAVKGTALINYNNATGELFGAMELDVLEKFGVGAMLIMDLGTQPGHYFSMVALLSARFSPGIPLGLGFSLTAVGGIIGLQRMLDYDAIREAVHSGTLESVFFVEDVVAHIGDMRKAAEKIFPAKRDQFFLGLLGQISYEPVVRCSIGLMMQLPDPKSIIVVGALKVGIEGTDVIRINVAFSGEIDFDRGIQFDASLYDSTIVGIRLEGDMAFRLFWGGPTKGFLMSVGGFHPAYTPEEGMNVSDMRRLSMKLDYSVLKIGLETYLAVTSNTFQIGARMDLKVGWDGFGLTGYAGFDALFQFDPFMFMFDIEAGMAVIVGGARILSVDLALSLSGPRPWHAAGCASFTLLFIPVSVDFDITWGQKKQELPAKQIEVLPLLIEQIDNESNWSVESGKRDRDVTLHSTEGSGGQQESPYLVLAPGGVLTFSQTAVPMELDMDLCNSAVPTDYRAVRLDKVSLGGHEWQIVNDDERDDEALCAGAIGETLKSEFAPALYRQMTGREKLSSPSYRKYASGFALNNGGHRAMAAGSAVTLDDYDCREGVYKTRATAATAAPMRPAGTPAQHSESQNHRTAFARRDGEAVSRYMDRLDELKQK